MKNSYRMKFGTPVVIMSAVLFLILAAGIVLSALSLSKWSPAETSTYWLDVLSLILIIIITTALISVVLNSKYILDDARLRLFFGFFGASIPVKDIMMIRTNPEKSVFLVYYKVFDKKTGETKSTFVTLNTKDAQKLADDIIKRNESVVFDIFTTDDEETKEE